MTGSTGPAKRDLRETYRQQLINSIGGWSGALIAAVPTTVFVIVNIASSLRPAIIASVASALALAGYRLIRKQSAQQALSGLLGVVVAALIAARTGEARSYFLLGIITSFLYSVPFGVSVLVRRPLVGLAWEFLDPTPAAGTEDAGTEDAGTEDAGTEGAGAEADTQRAGDGGTGSEADANTDTETAAVPVAWYRRRPLLVAYTWSTVVATAVFLVRGVVQLILYQHNATGWLAFARIAMGYPLFIAAIGFSFLVVTRARRRAVDAG